MDPLEAAAIEDEMNVEGVRKRVDLHSRRIGPAGARMLAEKLHSGRASIVSLDLVNNAIGSEGAIMLGSMLATNKSLGTLFLGCNGIGPEGGRMLGRGLASNETLKCLSLRENRIGTEGAKAFAEALKTNAQLVSLNLETNAIEPEGCVAIAQALLANETLVYLDLWNNKLCPASERAIANVVIQKQARFRRRDDLVYCPLTFEIGGITRCAVRSAREAVLQRLCLRRLFEAYDGFPRALRDNADVMGRIEEFI